MAAVDTETLQAEVNSLRAEVESLKVNLQHYMDISSHWGTENAALRKALREMGYKAELAGEAS